MNNTQTRVLSSVNQKGGVGKTTTLLNLGYLLAEQGKKVLFIDQDMQQNTTETLLSSFIENSEHYVEQYRETGIPVGSAALFHESAPLDIQECDPITVGNRQFYQGQIFILPSLAPALGEVSGSDAIDVAHSRFPELLELGFDYILIDCPPSPGVHQVTPISLSDHVLCPVELDSFSTKGLLDVWRMITSIHEMRGDETPKFHVYANKLHLQSSETKASLSSMKEELQDLMLDGFIASSAVIKDAVTHRRPIFKLPPNGNAAAVGKKYVKVLNELIERMEG